MAATASAFEQIFYKLVTSETLLSKYHTCSNMENLLQGLAADLGVEGLTSTQLLNMIQQRNKHAIPISLSDLKLCWLPSGYCIQRQQCKWQLKPQTLPFAPFYDAQLSQARGASLLSVLLQPATELQSLLAQAQGVERVKPVGFIFHLSRCGSTLMANALAATGAVQVISEASFLTDLLLDEALVDEQKIIALQMLFSIFDLPLLVKFNAWDIGLLPLIRQAFPDTPVLCLTREPFGILASHRHLAGIHMVPKNPVARYLDLPIGDSPLVYRCAVLQKLMTVMRQQYLSAPDLSVQILDYDRLSPGGTASEDVVERVCGYFSLPPLTASQRQQIRDTIHWDAKMPGQRFIAKVRDQYYGFDNAEIQFIQQALMPEYALLQKLPVDGKALF
ncbi:hypothetical protein [Gynuella sunshinyii]|uniref:Sulfotransferase family n=1 Tax=Gynuella sunshinyii YC6258 TaxID=1445510 RepID=A0A0C5VFK3_9GAMM|nr:hypothetical protein [Gynuella sunshinyii]AJQ93332.1 hypothetical Protein YC6258_01284 [Gynuella sunshinyii YC6258]